MRVRSIVIFYRNWIPLLHILWFDKCCIDQTNQKMISVALKCLPLYLQSCNTFMLLAGQSYFDRLWCIWELHLRFALREDRDPRIQVLELVAQGAAHRRLKEFRMRNATCFDPNQQAQLRGAIAGSQGGHLLFERQVRSLADRLPAPVIRLATSIDVGVRTPTRGSALDKYRGLQVDVPVQAPQSTPLSVPTKSRRLSDRNRGEHSSPPNCSSRLISEPTSPSSPTRLSGRDWSSALQRDLSSAKLNVEPDARGIFDWLCEEVGLAADVAKTYAHALAEDGFEGPQAWIDLPAESPYLVGVGMKRGHAERVVRILKQRQAQVQGSSLGDKAQTKLLHTDDRSLESNFARADDDT